MNSSPNQKIQNMSPIYIIWSTKAIFPKISKVFPSCRKQRVSPFFDENFYTDFGWFVTKFKFRKKIKSFDFLFYAHVKASLSRYF